MKQMKRLTALACQSVLELFASLMDAADSGSVQRYACNLECTIAAGQAALRPA